MSKGLHGTRSKIELIAGGLAVVVLLGVLASFFVDEPLRQYMERSLNADLHGYKARLPRLAFHPFGFSITLTDLTIAQDGQPEPPVAEFPKLHASVHWRALLHGRLVADFLFQRPRVHVNLLQLRHEAADKVPLKDKGWQQALESIYPLKINLFRVRSGDFTYIDDDPKRPLHISQLNLNAENIRNVRSPDRQYPSEVHLDGIIFDSGQVRADGQANFLAEPYAGIDTDFNLDQVDLSYFKPILARMNLWITGGTLSTDGRVEYAPYVEKLDVKHLTIHGAHVDYIHTEQTAAQEKERVVAVGHAANELTHAPAAVIHLATLHVASSTVGYVDRSPGRGYRLFLANSDLTIDNLSNQTQAEPASVRLKGQFMGSGTALLQGSVQPVANKPDLTMSLMVEGTKLTAMNDLLRTFGNFDVTSGQFSLYSEFRIKDDQISGYVKPLFADMKVYSRPQDANKPVLHQVYEGLVGAMQKLLRNPSGEVGTKVDISGQVSSPETSTWEIVLGLFENAFIKALGHGFEGSGDGATP